MNIFRRCSLIALFATVIAIIVACQSDKPQVASLVPEESELVVEQTAVPEPSAIFPPTSLPTATFIPTAASSPTAIPSFTNTPLPMATATPVFLQTSLAYAGTNISDDRVPISATNVQQLAYVAQWGNGSILGVAFAPDGNLFVVGTAVGFAIYDSANPNAQPRWILWEQPYFYESLFFSSDGNYLLLESRNESQVYRYADGRLAGDVTGVIWIKPSNRVDFGRVRITSEDESRLFTSYSTFAEDNVNIEIVIREIYDNNTGKLLYELPDETLYVQYDDYNAPEGCDLRSFSMCGNAYDPSAMQPYRVAFSSNGETFSALYRASNLWNSDQFSLLHVYSMNDGRVVARIGNFTQPVETFAYAPDGQSLLVGYGNGLIEMWDMTRIQPAFRLWHFDALISDVAYSVDGRYLLIQRQGWVEQRRTDNGILQSRYQANAFALSPTANLLALGTQDGQIIMQDMDTRQPIYTIQAHAAKIYALAFSPDGNVLASSGEDCRVQSWDVVTGSYLHDFAENNTIPYEEYGKESRIFIKEMTYVDDSDQLIGYGSWARVVSWQASTGDTQYMIEPEPLEYYNGMITLKSHFPEFWGFNPPNQSFLIDYTEYDLATGERLDEYQQLDGLPEGCAPFGPITPDGKLMFTRGYDAYEGQICILQTADWQLLQTVAVKSEIANQYDPMEWLYLSPGGEQLVVSSYSGVLQIYQVTETE